MEYEPFDLESAQAVLTKRHASGSSVGVWPSEDFTEIRNQLGDTLGRITSHDVRWQKWGAGPAREMHYLEWTDLNGNEWRGRGKLPNITSRPARVKPAR